MGEKNIREMVKWDNPLAITYVSVTYFTHSIVKEKHNILAFSSVRQFNLNFSMICCRQLTKKKSDFGSGMLLSSPKRRLVLLFEKAALQNQ